MRKFLCSKCGVTTSKGNYSYTGVFFCENCQFTEPMLHVDDIEFKNGIAILVDNFSKKDISKQHNELITMAYNIFNQKIAPRSFGQIKKYLKDNITYLEMIRTLEYHYLIKNGDITKSNFALGIIPYQLENAKKYFYILNQQRLKRYQAWYNGKEQQLHREVKISTSHSTKTIDMNSL